MESEWLICPMYHDMRAGEEVSFTNQVRFMRSLGDFIGLDEAVQLLGRARLGGRYFCLTFDDGYMGAYSHAHPILQEAALPSAFFVVPDWIDSEERHTLPSRNTYMTWDMCRDLSNQGVVIGSHTQKHLRLATLPAAEARAQLATSRLRIEMELGIACDHFACPWGQPQVDYVPERDPFNAQAIGYKSFLTTIGARADHRTNPFELPRIRLEPDWEVPQLKYMFGRS